MSSGPHFPTPIGSTVTSVADTMVIANLDHFSCWMDEQLFELELKYLDFQTHHSVAISLCGDSARKSGKASPR